MTGTRWSLLIVICLLLSIVLLAAFPFLLKTENRARVPSLIIFGDSLSSDIEGGYPGAIRRLRPAWGVEVHAWPGSNSAYIASQKMNVPDLGAYTHVLFMAGINDGWRGDYDWTLVNYKEFLDGWPEGVRRVVVMYPPEILAGSGTRVCHLTRAYNYYLGPFGSPGAEVVTLLVSVSNLRPDGLHVYPAGNVEIAESIIKEIEWGNK